MKKNPPLSRVDETITHLDGDDKEEKETNLNVRNKFTRLHHQMKNSTI